MHSARGCAEYPDPAFPLEQTPQSVCQLLSSRVAGAFHSRHALFNPMLAMEKPPLPDPTSAILRGPSRRQPSASPRGGMAVILALLAVGLAITIGLAIAAGRDATVDTSGAIVRTASARAAGMGALDISSRIIASQTAIVAGSPADDVREVFSPVTIGNLTISALMRDLATGRGPTEETLAIEVLATGRIGTSTQTTRAAARVPWQDVVSRADLDLSEFALLADGGGITIGAGSTLQTWKASPLSALGEPILIGTTTRSPGSVVFELGSIVHGEATIESGDFPTERPDFDEQLADGRATVPADIHVPEAPKPGVPSGAVTVAAGDFANDVNATVGEAVPHLVIPDGITAGTQASITGPIAPGTWRVIAIDGPLDLDDVELTFEVPTMLIARGDVSIRNTSRLQVAAGGALSIVSHGGVVIDDSYVGTILQAGEAVEAVSPLAPHAPGGAARVMIYAQPTLVRIEDGAVVKGEVYAPGATVTVGDASAVYGRVLGGSIALTDGGSVFYDPALNSGRGWLNPNSGIWETPTTVRSEVLDVARLDDESLGAFAAATGIAADMPSSGMIATIRVDAAGGYKADIAANSVDGGVAVNGALLPDGVGLDGGSGSTIVYPETFAIHGTIRDFREKSESGGHPDFDNPAYPNGLYCRLVQQQLGHDGKPALATTTAKATTTQARDSAGNPICWNLPASVGDLPAVTANSTKKVLTSASAFDSWFRDTPGLNISEPFTLLLRRTTDANGLVTYVFDSAEIDEFKSDGDGPALDGFFPIESRLYGNSQVRKLNNVTRNRNFHFTLELETTFVYRAGTAQLFAFRGDDDVWAFIDGKLVIDLGGMHSPISQVVHLDRLGLVDGASYPLKLFFAERRRNGSNFRVASNFPLASPLPPPPASDPMDWLRTLTTTRSTVRTQLFAGAFTSVDLASGTGFHKPRAAGVEF